MYSKIITSLALAFGSCSCSSAPVAQNDLSNPRSANHPQAVAQSSCDRLPELREMPRKDEPVDDPIYNDLVAAGNDAVPCLIDLITDLRPMDDPRKAPHVVHFVVGDAAFFMLHEITGVPIESSLPKEVAANIDTEGVYAYFNFSHHPANREKIKQWWESWWQSRKRENRN